MTITAKYASRCAACGGAIQPGAQIEWAKGQPVRHAACETVAKPVKARAVRTERCYKGHTHPVAGCRDCHDTFDY